MLRCEVCGRRLTISELLKGWRLRGQRSYPFVSMGGERNEHSVRYICERCEGRAARHRNDTNAPDGNGDDRAMSASR
jgi:hypothetical protein